MLRVHRIFLMLVLVLTAIPVVRLLAWKGVGEIAPMVEAIAPAEAHPGDAVTITGFQLDFKHVREVYLSGGGIGSDNGTAVYGPTFLAKTALRFASACRRIFPPGKIFASRSDWRTERNWSSNPCT